MWRVANAEPSDVGPWLRLAAQVEHLFGPMVGHGFEGAILSNIRRGSAFCVRDSATPEVLAGALLFDYRDSTKYELTWLAVEALHRRSGIGRELVRHALSRTVRPSTVRVVTFGPDHPGGPDARKFYASFGFVAGAPLEVGPEGGSRQEFVLEQGIG
jgi:GNAT superfamily N-acetyltransferase